AGCFTACKFFAKVVGRNRAVADLVPDDFRKLRAKFSKTRGAVGMRNAIQGVRSILKFAFDDDLIDKPIRFGQAFDKPKLATVRKAREAHRTEHGQRMLEAAELR